MTFSMTVGYCGRFRWMFIAVCLLLAGLPAAASAEGEGTRRITGSGMDVYFMDDKVFGTVMGRPLWAIYNCGSDIEGRMDAGGRYRHFVFQYHRQDVPIVDGRFGETTMALQRIEKGADGFVYHLESGGVPLRFSIHYRRVDADHLVDSTIKGTLASGRPIELKVDGRLCPFATSGIILIAAGALEAPEG